VIPYFEIRLSQLSFTMQSMKFIFGQAAREKITELTDKPTLQYFLEVNPGSAGRRGLK